MDDLAEFAYFLQLPGFVFLLVAGTGLPFGVRVLNHYSFVLFCVTAWPLWHEGASSPLPLHVSGGALCLALSLVCVLCQGL